VSTAKSQAEHNPAQQYSVLAEYYDRLNAEVDYGAIAEYCDRAVKNYGLSDSKLALDLACGTGSVTLKLAALGYDMIGADCSEEMLAVAAGRSKPDGAQVLWLKQDMRGFELYGTVGLIVCALDSINYLTDVKSLESCFSLAHNYLDPGGLFIFDVNTKYKFENVYAGHDYVLEADGVLCAWRSDYSARTGLCKFNLSIFTDEGGMWRRRDEVQVERMWSDRKLRAALKVAGFELITVTDGYSNAPATENGERHCYVTRAIKPL
jgi:Methylase involved in ubiquinone/menaquinone biosynthesis